VDLELNDDEVSLRDGIASLLSGRFDSDRIRKGFDAAMFAELEEAGVFSLVADGFTWSDAAIVFEQLGRHCVPGPLVDCAIARGLDGAGGVVGVCERPRSGEPAWIEHLDTLDALVVLDADGVHALDARALEGDRSTWPLDPLTPVAAVADLPRGETVADAGAARLLRRHGAALTAAFALGLSDRVTELSRAYALERRQFERPIGSFQAVKHILADMLVRTEMARATVYAAAAHLDAPDVEGLDRSVAVAKLVAGDAAIANGKAATQVHGGMGFTWEVDVHLFLKRAWVLETRFGSADEHADSLVT
jgi:alkylation response protein AidB-like acyl-CoA dehydrogenase